MSFQCSLAAQKMLNLGMNGLEWVIEHYFMKDGKPTVDVVISAMSFSLTTSLSGADSVSCPQETRRPNHKGNHDL